MAKRRETAVLPVAEGRKTVPEANAVANNRAFTIFFSNDAEKMGISSARP